MAIVQVTCENCRKEFECNTDEWKEIYRLGKTLKRIIAWCKHCGSPNWIEVPSSEY
jgi:transcription elongation factor Elf1